MEEQAEAGKIKKCDIMQPNVLKMVINAIISVVIISQPGCGKKSEHDLHSESKLELGSSQWNKMAAEDISVRIVAVLQRPAPQLSWFDEQDTLKLTREEKESIATNGVTGQMEVVSTTGPGGGSREVRVVIIQTSPLKANARLAVPERGSAIYIEKDGVLKPLFTNFPASSLTLEIYQEKRETTYFMDYPRDRVRSGGSIFQWDENGKWHEL